MIQRALHNYTWFAVTDLFCI